MKYSPPIRQYSEEEKDQFYTERAKDLLPITISPFTSDINGEQKLTSAERAPAWIDLFLDLSLVGCLTVFSIVHEVSLPTEVGTYVAFFSMLWFIWTTQVIYDVRYEMQDWFHRIAKLLQFAVFAFMAAYGGEFTAETYSEPPNLDVEDFFEWKYQGQAFKGVVLTLAVSRWLLAVQYFVVFLYSHSQHKRTHLIQPIVCALSGVCSAVAFAIRGTGPAFAVGKILLVYGSMFIEVVCTGYLARRKRGGGRLPRESMLAERFGLITLIILGEGAIGLFEAMHKAVSGLGLNGTSYSRVICAITVEFGLWWIIFSNYDKERPFKNYQAQAFLWLHYPFHLALVLFLQGVKRLIIHTNLFSAVGIIFDQWTKAIDQSQGGSPATFTMDEFPKLFEALHLLDLTLPPDLSSTNATFAAQEFLKFTVEVISTLFQKYGVMPSGELLQKIDEYGKDGTLATPAHAIDIANGLLRLSTNYAQYVCPTLGGVLVIWVLMTLVQKWPRDALDYILIAPRFLIGVGFCLLGFLDLAYVPATVKVENPDTENLTIFIDTNGDSVLSRWLDANWILPTIAIVLWSHIITNSIAQKCFHDRYQKRKRSSLSSVQERSPIDEKVEEPTKIAAEPAGLHDNKLFSHQYEVPELRIDNRDVP